MNGRKTRKQQITIMSVIAVAIVTLSIGFAVFSTSLRISSTAAVNPDSGSFSVVFSSNATTLETNAIAANPSTYGDSATIENGTVPTISGLNAKFTQPGQTVTYTFYALNQGAYLAYLNYINFNNVEGESKNIKCESGEGTTASLVESACNGISISVKVGSDAAVTTSQSGISNHTLSAGSSETIIVTITYNTGSVLADGPFNVIFGDIELIYSSALNGGSGSGTDTPSVATACEVVSGDGTQGGDEIACGDEHFYVVTNDGTNIEMITKYALNVGEYAYPGETVGIQSEKLDLLECAVELDENGGCGYDISPLEAYYGTTTFADESYWFDTDSYEYTDTKYSTGYIYDENSNVYEYVENYETYLKTELGITSASGTLANSTQFNTLTRLNITRPAYMTGLDDGGGGGIMTSIGANHPYMVLLQVRPIIIMSASELG